MTSWNAPRAPVAGVPVTWPDVSATLSADGKTVIRTSTLSRADAESCLTPTKTVPGDASGGLVAKAGSDNMKAPRTESKVTINAPASCHHSLLFVTGEVYGWRCGPSDAQLIPRRKRKKRRPSFALLFPTMLIKNDRLKALV